MAETTADVRRDIELTRERMSSTLAQLEQKMNVVQIVKDHPWPAIAVAFGAGVLLSGSKAVVPESSVTTRRQPWAAASPMARTARPRLASGRPQGRSTMRTL